MKNPKNQTPNPPNLSDRQLAHKNARTGLTVMAVIFVMIGLSFASVPLYDLFCRATGFDGTTGSAEALPDTILERKVTIKFNADIGRNMPWDFNPEMREIEVQLGQKGLTAFHARNKAAKPVSGTALYNVTPLKAGKYFRKVECFCFAEQTLQPGQEVSMPVMFFIDPSMDEDPDMADVKVITLSYTFYEGESNELEDAMEAFYNDDGSAIQTPSN